MSGDRRAFPRCRDKRASARARRSIALGGCGREECVDTPRVRSVTVNEILSRTVTAARFGRPAPLVLMMPPSFTEYAASSSGQ